MQYLYMDWRDNLFWRARQMNANWFSHPTEKKRHFKKRPNLFNLQLTPADRRNEQQQAIAKDHQVKKDGRFSDQTESKISVRDGQNSLSRLDTRN